MGTWGECLYDDDGALDELGELLDVLPLHAGAVPMATTVGVVTWLHGSLSDCCVEAIQKHQDWVWILPEHVSSPRARAPRRPRTSGNSGMTTSPAPVAGCDC